MSLAGALVSFAIACWAADYAACSSVDALPYVATTLGGVRGHYKTSAEGRRYAAFEGIPYAMVPTGERRFEPPVPVAPWSEDIDARTLPQACAQFHSIDNALLGVEDCLYLNVYAPLRNLSETPVPVIFWIAGGGFQYGTGSKYGAKFLVDRDLILVTFNYRVGAFGFLSTGDAVVPGNMGLKDQSLALRWVSEHISRFGGDPARITLTGVSAGGASVHYHYLSPMSAGLFNNGISFSGTALAPWAYLPDTSESAKSLAESLKCPSNDSAAMIACFKTVPADDITLAIRDMLSDLYFSYVLFTPVAEKTEDNYFINDSPKSIIENGLAYDVPWIAGVVSEEGLYITASFALDEKMMAHTDENWEKLAPYMLHYVNSVPESRHARIANSAKLHYSGSEPFTTGLESIRNLTHLAGDLQIVLGTIQAATLQARINKSPVRSYYYSYRAAQSSSDHWSNSTVNFGVSHDDDIFMVLENQYIDPTTTESDRSMLRDMLQFWHSFASTGSPDLGTDWPKLNPSEKEFQYMHMAGPGNFKMRKSDNLGEKLFWEKLGF